MSSAAVTLQCPACGGVFLTLQQGTGGAEICPHCSMSAPRTRYRAMESQASPGARAMLPPRRTGPQPVAQPAMAATAAQAPAATLEAPVPSPSPTRWPAEPFNAAQPYRPPPVVALPSPPVPPPVMSEGIPQVPEAPPLPSRVLQTFEQAPYSTPCPAPAPLPLPLPPAGPMAPPAFETRAFPAPAESSVASPFSSAVVPSPPLAPEAPVPPVISSRVLLPPVAPPSAMVAPSAPPAIEPQIPAPSQPAFAASPVVETAVPMPQPVPASGPPAVAVPAAVVESAATAKASPAQLWEAAVLQQSPLPEPGTALTGRELFPVTAPSAFQPAPTPPAPLAFGPLVPTVGSAPAGAAASPAQMPVERPQMSGTVLPAARSMPPSALPAGFGALPEAAASVNPLPPPQIGFAPEAALPAASPEPPSPPLPQPPLGVAAAVAAPPLPAPPGLSMPSAQPLLPHIPQLRQPASPMEAESVVLDPRHHAPSPAAQNLTPVAAKVVRNNTPPAVSRTSRRRMPWVTGLVLGSLAVAGGLHFAKNMWSPKTAPLPPPVQAGANLPARKPAAPSGTATPMVAVTAAKPPTQVSSPAPAPPPAPAPSKKEPEVAEMQPAALSTAPAPAPVHEEVRRAIPSDAATLSISKEDPLPAIAAKLMFGIDSATTPEERARWIADPDKHSLDMERLIRTRGGRLNTREITPLPAPVHALPSGEEVPLFRVSSPASRGGAILRLHPQNGAYVIDWPLFAQTYDNAFDRFVAANRAIPGNAEWYTVLCSLVGDPSAGEAQREKHLRLQVQGSLAETGSTEAWADKTSPVGRYLLKEMAPRRMYLIEMQFGASDAGSRRLMVLDCAATKGKSAQANANK